AETTVILTALRPTDSPAALNDAYSTPVNTPLVVPAPGILANDNGVLGTTTTLTVGSGSVHGTLTLDNDGGVTYTPAPDYTGPDRFLYTVNNGGATSNVAMVTIGIGPATMAGNDGYTTDENVVLNVAAPGVLANDGGTSLSAWLVAGPTYGSVALAA